MHSPTTSQRHRQADRQTQTQTQTHTLGLAEGVHRKFKAAEERVVNFYEAQLLFASQARIAKRLGVLLQEICE